MLLCPTCRYPLTTTETPIVENSTCPTCQQSLATLEHDATPLGSATDESHLPSADRPESERGVWFVIAAVAILTVEALAILCFEYLT
jgi:hypothetical protein